MKPESNKYIMLNGEKRLCYQQEIPSEKVRLLFIVWKLLTSKRFRGLFFETFKYALRHYDSYFGFGSSEVFLFTCEKEYSKIWKRN